MKIVTGSAAAVLTSVLLIGCAADDPYRSTKTGAVIGGIAGAVIGNQSSRSSNRYLGAAVGALAGAAVGNYMDRQRQELERALADERAREELHITEMEGNALRIGIASDVTFEFDSSDLRTGSRDTYNRIAEVLADFDQTIIHVVGHTDNTGAASYNQGLSERRAESVALHMRSRGLDGDRLVIEGRGLREPVATNETTDGRRQNRRVDIVVKPIVEGEERKAYEAPPYLGRG